MQKKKKNTIKKTLRKKRVLQVPGITRFQHYSFLKTLTCSSIGGQRCWKSEYLLRSRFLKNFEEVLNTICRNISRILKKYFEYFPRNMSDFENFHRNLRKIFRKFGINDKKTLAKFWENFWILYIKFIETWNKISKHFRKMVLFLIKLKFSGKFLTL